MINCLTTLSFLHLGDLGYADFFYQHSLGKIVGIYQRIVNSCVSVKKATLIRITKQFYTEIFKPIKNKKDLG
jgi:hypothetical protein